VKSTAYLATARTASLVVLVIAASAVKVAVGYHTRYPLMRRGLGDFANAHAIHVANEMSEDESSKLTRRLLLEPSTRMRAGNLVGIGFYVLNVGPCGEPYKPSEGAGCRATLQVFQSAHEQDGGAELKWQAEVHDLDFENGTVTTRFSPSPYELGLLNLCNELGCDDSAVTADYLGRMVKINEKLAVFDVDKVKIPVADIELPVGLALWSLLLAALSVLGTLIGTLGQVRRDPDLAREEPWLLVDARGLLAGVVAAGWYGILVGTPLLVTAALVYTIALRTGQPGLATRWDLSQLAVAGGCLALAVGGVGEVSRSIRIIRRRRRALNRKDSGEGTRPAPTTPWSRAGAAAALALVALAALATWRVVAEKDSVVEARHRQVGTRSSVRWESIAAEHWKTLSAGPYVTCGITTSDRWRCWGSDVPREDSPAARSAGMWPPDGAFTSLSVGGDGLSCAIDTQQRLHCIGSRGSAVESHYAERRALDVDTNGGVVCVIDERHEVSCLDVTPVLCTVEALDAGTCPATRPPWAAPQGPFDVVRVSRGAACGVRQDRTLTCWGSDARPTGAVPPAGLFRDVCVSGRIACALADSGAVTCWSAAGDAQLPVQAPAGTFTQISCGQGYPCGARQDGAAICWGQGRPSAVRPNERFTQVISSYQKTCGLHVDGTAVCWGCTGLDTSCNL
jgi:hypothetical protein